MSDATTPPRKKKKKAGKGGKTRKAGDDDEDDGRSVTLSESARGTHCTSARVITLCITFYFVYLI